MQDLAKRISAAMMPLVQTGQVRLTQLPHGLAVEINASVLFAPGQAVAAAARVDRRTRGRREAPRRRGPADPRRRPHRPLADRQRDVSLELGAIERARVLGRATVHGDRHRPGAARRRRLRGPPAGGAERHRRGPRAEPARHADDPRGARVRRPRRCRPRLPPRRTTNRSPEAQGCAPQPPRSGPAGAKSAVPVHGCTDRATPVHGWQRTRATAQAFETCLTAAATTFLASRTKPTTPSPCRAGCEARTRRSRAPRPAMASRRSTSSSAANRTRCAAARGLLTTRRAAARGAPRPRAAEDLGLEVPKRIKSPPCNRGVPVVVPASPMGRRDVPKAHMRGAPTATWCKPVEDAALITALGDGVAWVAGQPDRGDRSTLGHRRQACESAKPPRAARAGRAAAPRITPRDATAERSCDGRGRRNRRAKRRRRPGAGRPTPHRSASAGARRGDR